MRVARLESEDPTVLILWVYIYIYIYIYILCLCLGFAIMYLKAAINRIVSFFVNIGHISRTT